MRLIELRIADLHSYSRDQPAHLKDLDAFNVLIGPNNCGKSNVFRFLKLLWQNAKSLGEKPIELGLPHDTFFPNGSEDYKAVPEGTATFHVPNVQAVELGREHQKSVRDWLQDQDLIARVILATDRATDKTRLSIGLDGPPHDRQNVRGSAPLRRSVAALLAESLIFLDAWRNRSAPRAGGKGLVEGLQELAHASSQTPNGHEMRRRFRKIEAFFKEIVQLPDAHLRVTQPGSSPLIEIEIDGRLRPLDRFGDGLTHALLIAYEVANQQHKVFFIEEPETHLHPRQQRVLYKFISDRVAEQQKAANQFVMTTHSPVLLDEGLRMKPQIWSIRHNGTHSILRNATTRPDLYEVLDELDVRPSDLLQANVVIWVEGPSDRLFLNRCIELVTEGALHEGIHYQIVLYGGALLAHVEPGSDDQRFIDILRVGRKAIIVMDSDKAREEDDLGVHKARIAEQAPTFGALAWITAGREIENYLSERLIKEMYKDAGAASNLEFGPFDRLEDQLKLAFPTPAHGFRQFVDYAKNKPQAMARILEKFEDKHLDCLDLRERLGTLVQYINRAQADVA